MSAKLSYLSLITAVVLFASANHADANGYTFTDLGGSLSMSNSAANAINNFGLVAGYATITGNSNVRHATLWNGTRAIDLGTLGGLESIANDINDIGQVAGWAHSLDAQLPTVWDGTKLTVLSPGGNSGWANAIYINGGIVVGSSVISTSNHATQWDASGTTDLGTLSGNIFNAHSEAFSINHAGTVVGSSSSAVALGGTHATRWNGTIATDLGTLPGGGVSEARAINDAGQVVGWSTLTSIFDRNQNTHATMWNGAVTSDLGTLGGNWSEAHAINNAGQVVGWSTIAGDTASHATIWNGSTATDLNSFLDSSMVNTGWVLVEANDINNNGWIAATAVNEHLGIHHAFLLIPDFGASPANPILPSANLSGGWQFEFNVWKGTIYVDPLVSTGYDYFVDSGPNFTSVLLPNVGDDEFALYLWNGIGWMFDSTLSAGTEHSFGGLGVDRFRIEGIEASAGLDPNSPTEFITGLNFAQTGDARMHMVPIVQEVSEVSEPGAYAILLTGLGLMSFMCRRCRPA